MTNYDTSQDKMLAATQWAAFGQIISAVAAMVMVVYAAQTLKNSIEESNEARKNDERYFNLMERPIVRFERLNHVFPVSFDPVGPMFVDIARFKDGTAKEPDKLPTIRNFGGGPALDVELIFVVEKANGSEIAPEYTKVTPSPANMLAGSEAVVYQLPKCLWSDRDKAIREVEGWVQMQFKQGDNTERSAFQRFKAVTYYDQKSPQIYFEFNDVD